MCCTRLKLLPPFLRQHRGAYYLIGCSRSLFCNRLLREAYQPVLDAFGVEDLTGSRTAPRRTRRRMCLKRRQPRSPSMPRPRTLTRPVTSSPPRTLRRTSTATSSTSSHPSTLRRTCTETPSTSSHPSTLRRTSTTTSSTSSHPATPSRTSPRTSTTSPLLRVLFQRPATGRTRCSLLLSMKPKPFMPKTPELALEGTFSNAVKQPLVEKCFGVIDCGATASLGSVDALEAIINANIANEGAGKIEVDVTRRPVFRFGNGERKQCLSTARLQVAAGKLPGVMDIHVHDTPNQPVLISRRALKSLGAVIDFQNNECIFKKVDPTKVVILKEAENGHLLLPLVGNLMDNATDRETAFRGLRLPC